MGITVIVGLMIFLSFLNSGMVLYVKNTSIITAHQQARAGVDQCYKTFTVQFRSRSWSMHPNSIAILDGSGNPATAPGISFQSFSAGPFPVVVGASATDTSLRSTARATRLPSARGSIFLRTTSSSTSSAQRCRARSQVRSQHSSTAESAPVWNRDGHRHSRHGGRGWHGNHLHDHRVDHRAEGLRGRRGDLRYCPSVTSNHLADLINSKVITRNITSASPFTIPFGPGSPPTPQNNFVAAVNLSTADPAGSARGYGAVDMFISSKIPFRSRLTNSQ